MPQLGEYQLTFLLTGLGAVALARQPDGIAADLGRALRRLRSTPEPVALDAVDLLPSHVDVADAPLHEGDVVLAVAAVAVRFGGVQALSDVSFEARAGTVTGIIGPNGAGKTTLFNVLTGLQRPDAGQVLLRGVDVSRAPTHKRARLGLARTFQRLEVFGSLTVLDNVRAAAEIRHGRAGQLATAEEALRRVGLEHLAHVPVWVGGNSLRSLRRAIDQGEGWMPFGLSLDQLDAILGQVERPEGFDVVLGPSRQLDPLGDADRVRRTVDRLAQAGATVASVSLAADSKTHYVEQIHALKELVP